MARVKSRNRNKTKFKWTKELILLLVAILVLAGVTIVLNIPSKKEKMYESIVTAQTTAEVEATLDEDNVFKTISYKALDKKINSDEYTYVYYGSKNISDWLIQIETVNQKAQDFEIDTVYLFSSVWAEELDLDDTDDAAANQKKLDAREDALDGVDLLTYPSIWVFKSGKVVFDSTEVFDDPYVPSSQWTFVLARAFGNPEKKASLE